MDQTVRVDCLLFAVMLLCSSVVAWVGVPSLPLASRPRGWRFMRFGGPLFALVFVFLAFLPAPRHPSPTTLWREQLLALLTPLLWLLALFALAAAVLAVLTQYRSQRRRRQRG